jgi:hypothetical protein
MLRSQGRLHARMRLPGFRLPYHQVPWSVVLCLVALPLLAIVAYQTESRTPVRLEFDGETLSWEVAGNTVQVPASTFTTHELVLVTSPSIYPMGIESLAVRTPGRTLSLSHAAVPFAFQAKGPAPLGDWVIDDWPANETVLDQPLQIDGPFVLDAVFVGRTSHNMAVHLVGPTDVQANFRRGLINDDLALTDPAGHVAANAAPVEPDEALRDLANLFAQAAIASCVIVLLMFVLGVAVDRIPLRRIGLTDWPRYSIPLRRIGLPDWHRYGRAVCAIAVLVAAACALTWLNTQVLEGLTHIPDGVSYLLFARWLANGQLGAALPAAAQYFDLPGSFVQGNQVHSVFPMGWPLLLALGLKMGLPPAVMTPLCGWLCLVALLALAQQVHGWTEALVATTLLAISPLFLLLSASYMAHVACGLFLLVGVGLIVRSRRHPRALVLQLGVAGASLGLAFSVRPGTAAAFAPGLGLYLLLTLREAPAAQRPAWLRALLAFVVTGLLGAMIALLGNWLLVGEWSFSVYTGYGQNALSLANVNVGLGYVDAELAYLTSQLFGWGWPLWWGGSILALSFAFALVPFVMGSSTREDTLCAGLFLSLVGVYAFQTTHGLHGFGARYLFEGTPLICLLSARGMVLLAGTGNAWFASRRALGITRATATLAAALLIGSAAWGLPTRLSQYHDYNGIDSSLEQAYAALPDKRALILLPGFGWYDWGRAGRLLSADLATPAVFADARNSEADLRAAFPDRPCYRWQTPALVPCGQA